MNTVVNASNATFCVHVKFKSNAFLRYVFSHSLKKASNNKAQIRSNGICDGEICIFVYAPVVFKNTHFKLTEDVLNSNGNEISYSSFKKISLFSKKVSLVPDWSPIRFLQFDYLKPVIAVKNEKSENLSEYSDDQILELIMNSKVKKIPGINYTVLTFRELTGSRAQISSTQNYLSKVQPKIKIEIDRRSRVQLSFKELAPRDISIVVPTRGTLDLESHQSAIVELAKSLNEQEIGQSKIELVVVFDSDSDGSYLDEIKKISQNFETKFVSYDPPFNFSKKSNVGARNATGEVIIFLNDDTKFISQTAVIELAGAAMLEKVGAVGAKLYFKNGSIQHAGTVVIGDNVGHAYFKQINPEGSFGDLNSVHEVSAVTGACFAQRKIIWELENGWDEKFDNSYNDVEYCFRLRDAGYSILQNNFIELFHFESLSRDATFSPLAKTNLKKKWTKFLKDDQFFPQYVESQKHKNRYKQFAKRIIRKIGINE